MQSVLYIAERITFYPLYGEYTAPGRRYKHLSSRMRDKLLNRAASDREEDVKKHARSPDKWTRFGNIDRISADPTLRWSFKYPLYLFGHSKFPPHSDQFAAGKFSVFFLARKFRRDYHDARGGHVARQDLSLVASD